MSSDRRTVRLSEAGSESASLAEARFIPQGYEPNYAYPLLVMFHGRGGDEHQMATMMPSLSWRNYVALSLRGPESIVRRGRALGHTWGPHFARPNRMVAADRPRLTTGETFRRFLADGRVDGVDRLEEGVFHSVHELLRETNVHGERIYAVGVGEGAAVAYHMALSHPDRFAGVVAVNGWLPSGAPLARVKECRSLRILVVHGEWNDRAPIGSARRDVATLRAGGLRVAFHAYPCGHRLTSPMLADVDTWLMRSCSSAIL